MSAPETPWIAHPRCGPRTRVRLFCFPYAGGAASLYRGFAEALPQRVGVLPVELPGRGTRYGEPAPRDFSELMGALVPALLPHLAPPFAFFGYSLGALLGFELARELRRRGAPGPAHLFVCAIRAPQLPRRGRPISGLSQEEFVERLKRLGGTPEEVLADAELLELVLPTVRADFEASETWEYAPGPPLDCPISTFGGADDALVDRAGLEAWSEQTRAAFRLRIVPGAHFFLESARREVLAAVAEDL